MYRCAASADAPASDRAAVAAARGAHLQRHVGEERGDLVGVDGLAAVVDDRLFEARLPRDDARALALRSAALGAREEPHDAGALAQDAAAAP
jgi:hypothetical protein